MVGVEEEKVQSVIDVIKEICKKRKEILVTPTTLVVVKVDICNNILYKLSVGGATIFVIDVDQFIKI